MKRIVVRGQLLIEVLITIALLALIAPAVIMGIISANQGDAFNQHRTEAALMIKELYESVRVARELSWSQVANVGTYVPIVEDGTWKLSTGSATVNGYTKQVEISDVQRDGSGVIVASGGTNDPSTRQVKLTVSWTSPQPGSLTQDYYLTRYLDNIIATDTTEEQFKQGTLAGVAVTNNSGGEIALGAGGGADWCRPELTIAAVDLPKSGVANAISAIPTRVVAGTGENASGVSFANVVIDNNKPPQASVTGSFDGYKTNDIFTESNYAYVATDNNGEEIIILDLTQLSGGKSAKVGYFNAPGNGSGTSVVVSGNLGFMVAGSTLYSFDLSSKNGARSLKGTFALPGQGTGLKVVGNTLYVAIANNAKKLQLIRFDASGATLTAYGYADPSAGNGRDVATNLTGTRAYLATALNATTPEFFVIDAAAAASNNPQLPILSNFDTNGMNPTGVTVVPGNRAIVVGTQGEEYQVLSLSNETTVAKCGGLNIDSGVNGISSVIEPDNDAYSYIITGDASSELKIIEGGPGGQYSNQGTFVSRIIDVGYSSVFNFFDWNVQVPSLATLQYQVALADAVNGSCDAANYVFVGPSRDSSTYFSEPSVLPFDDDGVGYENPGRCFRYKLYLMSSDPIQSPEFLDMTINYNP